MRRVAAAVSFAMLLVLGGATSRAAADGLPVPMDGFAAILNHLPAGSNNGQFARLWTVRSGFKSLPRSLHLARPTER